MKAPLLLIPVLIVGLAGCGGSPHEKAIDSTIDLMAEMNDVLDGVKDVKSAEAALPKLKALRKKQDEAEKTMSALGAPAEDERESLEKPRKRFQEQMSRMVANQERLVQIPGVQQVLDQAMASGR